VERIPKAARKKKAGIFAEGWVDYVIGDGMDRERQLEAVLYASRGG